MKAAACISISTSTTVIYLYLDECDRMVHIGDAEALCMDGSAAAYQAGQAKEYKTIEMEEAMRLLGQERRAG